MVEGRRWIHASGIHGIASCSITSHGWHGWGGREPRTRIDDHFLRAESEYFCVLLVEESFILVIREDDLVMGNLRYRSMSLKFLLIFNFRCRIRDKLAIAYFHGAAIKIIFERNDFKEVVKRSGRMLAKTWWRGKFIGIGKYFAGSYARLFLRRQRVSLSWISAHRRLRSPPTLAFKRIDAWKWLGYFIAIINARAADRAAVRRESNVRLTTTLVTLAMKDARPTRPGRGPSAISYVPSNVGSVTGSLIHRESRRFSPFPLLLRDGEGEYFKRLSLNARFQSLCAYTIDLLSKPTIFLSRNG